MNLRHWSFSSARLYSGVLWLAGLLALALGNPAAGAPAPMNDKSKAFVEEFLKEIQVPDLLFCARDQSVCRTEGMPEFDAKILAAYPASSAKESKLRSAVIRARALLWALSGKDAPADLADTVKALRSEVKIDPATFPERYLIPLNENQFKNRLLATSRQQAQILSLLGEALEELQLNSKDRDAEPIRWRAHYDFIEARLMLQITQVYEYQSMLGQMRRELPPYDPKIHRAWELNPTEQVHGDPEGKKMARQAHKTLESLNRTHLGTPWETLGTRLKGARVGLEWQAVK
jgi:hypothetical protein